MVNNIELLRRQKELSVKQLAALIGVSGSAVSQWEAGAKSPSKKNLEKLAHVLDTSVDCLLGKEKDPPIGKSLDDLLTRLEGYSLAELREIQAYANYQIYRKEREQTEGQGSADTQ